MNGVDLTVSRSIPGQLKRTYARSLRRSGRPVGFIPFAIFALLGISLEFMFGITRYIIG